MPAANFGKRTLAIGSSTTFDPGVSGDAATWPARLQFWLAQLSPAHTVEVINAGVPGYVVMTDLIRLETNLYRYRPDVIVRNEGLVARVQVLRFKASGCIGERASIVRR